MFLVTFRYGQGWFAAWLPGGVHLARLLEGDSSTRALESGAVALVGRVNLHSGCSPSQFLGFAAMGVASWGLVAQLASRISETEPVPRRALPQRTTQDDSARVDTTPPVVYLAPGPKGRSRTPSSRF